MGTILNAPIEETAHQLFETLAVAANKTLTQMKIKHRGQNHLLTSLRIDGYFGLAEAPLPEVIRSVRRVICKINRKLGHDTLLMQTAYRNRGNKRDKRFCLLIRPDRIPAALELLKSEGYSVPNVRTEIKKNPVKGSLLQRPTA